MSLEKDGYAIYPGFFNDKDLFEFKEALRFVIRAAFVRARVKWEPGKEFDQGIMELESINHSYVAEIYDTVAQIPEFLRLISSYKLQNLIGDLFGSHSPLYLFTNRCRIDPPNDDRRTYGWHQEVFYTLPKSVFLQTWAPLIRDTTIENGTIEICKGSHESGIARQKWIDAPERATQIIVDPEEVMKYEKIRVPMRLGDLMVFKGTTFHRSGKNTSNEIRYSLVGMYHKIANPDFQPPQIDFKYRGLTPKQYYELQSLSPEKRWD